MIGFKGMGEHPLLTLRVRRIAQNPQIQERGEYLGHAIPYCGRKYGGPPSSGRRVAGLVADRASVDLPDGLPFAGWESQLMPVYRMIRNRSDPPASNQPT